MWAIVIVLGILMTLKYFPGLENEDAYAGLSYQAIHPAAMAGDPFYGPELEPIESSYKVSAYYLLPKLFGEIWLDDRFIAAVYLALVIVAIVGIDRLARILGAETIAERMLVLAIALKDHDLILNKVLVAHHPDFNHSALTIPFVIWLLWFALARKGLAIVLATAAVAAAISVKTAALPVAAALLIVARNGQVTWERKAAAGLFVAASAMAIVAILVVLAPPASERLELWDAISREFMGPGNILLALERGNWQEAARYAAFVVLMVACLTWPCEKTPAVTGVHVAVALSLVIWAFGNIYIPYAPDALKQPLILPFSLTSRIHQFPQILATVALAAMVVRWIKARFTPARMAAGLCVLLLLFMTGPGNYGAWLATLAASAAIIGAVALALWWRNGKPAVTGLLTKDRFTTAVALLLSITLTASLAGTTAIKNFAAWRMLFERGVYGNATTAPWVDVAGYIRRNTPEGARILAMVMDPERGRLKPVRSLATRTGRTMTATHRGTSQFDIARWRLEERQTALLRETADAWMRGDAAVVRDRLSRVVSSPDYVVIPSPVVDCIVVAEIGFARETDIGQFTILKRVGTSLRR